MDIITICATVLAVATPVLGIFGWVVVKFLDGKFTTVQTFNNFVEAQKRKDDDAKDEHHADIDRLDNYIQVVDKKAQDSGKSISGLEVGAEALERAIDRIENRLDR